VRQSNPFFSDGPFRQVIINGTFVVNDARQLGLTGDRTITVDNYGTAAAYRVSDYVSFGLGLSIYRFNASSNFGSLTFGQDPFGPADPGTKGQNSTTVQSGHDTRAGVNAGALVALNKKIRFGAVFRQGVTFDFQQVNTVSGSAPLTKTGRFRMPWVVGAGVRIVPAKQWLFAFDYDRVQYSRLRDDYISFQVDPNDLQTISIPNGNELHFAAEYTFGWLAPHQPSLRLGAWYDPTHSVHYATDLSNSDTDIRLRAIFPPGESLWHFSIGTGLPLSDDYEVNVGADFTKGRHYVSASLVARFGK
jgi:long-subunit fatty acid transport protein